MAGSLFAMLSQTQVICKKLSEFFTTIQSSADVSAHRPTKWTDTMLNKDNFILVECSFDLNSCASYAFFSFLLRKHTIGTGTNILAHRRLEGNI